MSTAPPPRASATEPPRRSPTVAVEGLDGDAVALLDSALAALGFEQQCRAREEAQRAVILLDLGAFEPDSPVLPSRALVEHLVDRLAAIGFSSIALASSSDSSSTWCQNREVYALAELFGYRYETSAGTPYDVLDLSEELSAHVFPAGSALESSPLSSNWLNASFRVLLAKGCTDQREGFTLGASTLLLALPHRDKDLAYRLTMAEADALDLLLDVAPPHFTIIDLIGVAHGSGGRVLPRRAPTSALVVSYDLLAADAVAAAKLGSDPARSRLWSGLTKRRGAPLVELVSGHLRPLEGVLLPDAFLVEAARGLERSGVLARALPPWQQRLDPTLFPFKHPLDEKLHARLAPPLGLEAAGEQATLTLFTQLWSALDFWISAVRTNQAKELVFRRRAGVSRETLDCGEDEYTRMECELDALRAWLTARGAAPGSGAALRWYKQDDAVVFGYWRDYPVPFEEFTERVDVSRTIQLMEDYLGGTILVRSRDEQGRPVRQVERNLYLPQPNYLAYWGGREIDVSKIESIHYCDAQQRMYWKTIKSENGSALADDGVVIFEAITPTITRALVQGRQRFTLPLWLEAARLERVPELEGYLIEHAYERFFSRTFANFEALLEGREIAIGMRLPNLAMPYEVVPRPIDTLAKVANTWLEALGPLLQTLGRPFAETTESKPAVVPAGTLDRDGFSHFAAPPPAPRAEPASDVHPREQLLWGEFVSGYVEAVSRDWAALASAPPTKVGDA